MYKNLTYFFACLLCLVLSNNLQAQNKADSALTAPERAAVNLYNKTMGDRLGIYRGPEVLAYTLRSVTNPNFRDTTDFYEDGVVNYDNRTYYRVPLLYNVERDLLESRINSATPFNLLSDRVVDFSLLGRHFVRFTPQGNNKIMPAGFYGLLYDGKIQVFGRYVKTIQTEVHEKTTVNSFYPQTTYFLKRGTVYYNANSRGKFLDALKDKKKELQQYIKDNKIDFSENPERAMIVLAAYYDHLTN